MGIRQLNIYLKKKCPESISLVSLEELKHKPIVVDISIYLYRFQAEGDLIDGMYQFLAIFNHYQIPLLIVFDGKPPDEKKEILKKRKQEKQLAEEKYNQLETTGQHTSSKNLKQLRKLMTRISYDNVKQVKKLIHLFGLPYYNAVGEADMVCADFVKSGKAWACLSEDMDLFMYGCPRVLRYLSLYKSNVVLYSLENILNKLQVSQDEFNHICIVSGTDYNIQDCNCKKCIQSDTETDQNTRDDHIPIHKAFKYYKYYKEHNSINNLQEQQEQQEQSQHIKFYTWLYNQGYINESDIHTFTRTNLLFQTNELNCAYREKQSPYSYNKYTIQQFLEEYDFIFV
jgi:5'-3' exonuclease